MESPFWNDGHQASTFQRTSHKVPFMLCQSIWYWGSISLLLIKCILKYLCMLLICEGCKGGFVGLVITLLNSSQGFILVGLVGMPMGCTGLVMKITKDCVSFSLIFVLCSGHSLALVGVLDPNPPTSKNSSLHKEWLGLNQPPSVLPFRLSLIEKYILRRFDR